MIRIRKRWYLAVILLGVFLLFAYSILTGIWGEYGGHNLHIALAEYVEANDGAWPESWEDIEPYHSDPLLGIESTFFVRQYWGVAWDIDPEEIIRTQSPRNAKSSSVVYSLHRLEDPESIEYWELGGRIVAFYIEREQ